MLLMLSLQMTREHIQDEEQNFLPRLSELASPWELNRLARQFEAARGAAPTRYARVRGQFTTIGAGGSAAETI